MNRTKLTLIRSFLIVWTALALVSAGSASADNRSIKVKLAEMRTEKRTALLIGNANYQFSPLQNPVHDVQLMEKTLKQLGFEVVKLEDANQRDMKKAIDQFGEMLRSGGVGFFYYAGHGIQVKEGNYLIPLGADLKVEGDVEYEAVDVGRVIARMEAAGNRLNIVMLDACRNNPFVASSKRSATRGLATLDAPKGTFIAYATAPGKVAEDGEGANGLYTSEFIKAISIPGLKIEDVFKQVRAEVRSKTNGLQIPWESSSLEGDFYFQVPTEDGAVTQVAYAPQPALVPQSAASTPLAREEERPANTISIKFKNPRSGMLSVNNRTYDLRREPVVYFPKGQTAFSIYLDDKGQTVYGVLDVKVVDDSTMAWVFGMDKPLLKDTHIEKALLGQPVLYGMRTNTEDGAKEVFTYRLSLHKIK